MALKPKTTVEDVKAAAAAKRAAAKAKVAAVTAAPAPAPAAPAPAPVVEDDGADPDASPVSNIATHPHTLADVANATGLTGTRINGYRRAGSLPDGSAVKDGRPYVYNDAAVEALKQLKDGGAPITRASRKSKGATNGAAAPAVAVAGEVGAAAPVARGRKPATGAGADVLGALDAAIAAAEAEAKRNAELAASLKSQRKTFGGR